jgi:hypothetical protein
MPLPSFFNFSKLIFHSSSTSLSLINSKEAFYLLLLNSSLVASQLKNWLSSLTRSVSNRIGLKFWGALIFKDGVEY